MSQYIFIENKSNKEKKMEPRTCPYCGKKLVERPYWRHIEKEHPEEYASDRKTWIQLYKDYTSMGMDMEKSLQVISEIFNKDTEEIKAFLKKHDEL